MVFVSFSQAPFLWPYAVFLHVCALPSWPLQIGRTFRAFHNAYKSKNPTIHAAILAVYRRIFLGASDRSWTCNPLITNQLRCHCATLAKTTKTVYHQRAGLARLIFLISGFVCVGLSMICYTMGAEAWSLYLARKANGSSQPGGRIGKWLYFLLWTASCFWKSRNEYSNFQSYSREHFNFWEKVI